MDTEESHLKSADVKNLLSSDEIVKDLLSDLKNIAKPFAVSEVDKESDEETDRKSHKHKKKKKKHSSKRSRKRSRSRSRERKNKRRKRSRESSSSSRSVSHTSRTSSRSGPSTPRHQSPGPVVAPAVEETEQVTEPIAVNNHKQPEEVEDDLPVGADYTTVLKEAKTASTSGMDAPPLDLASLPVDPKCSTVKKNLMEEFPLKKDVKNENSDDVEPKTEKVESEMLKKVIAEKGNGDLVPRNLKIKVNIPSALTVKSETVEPKLEDKADNQNTEDVTKSPNNQAAKASKSDAGSFGCDMPPVKTETPDAPPDPEQGKEKDQAKRRSRSRASSSDSSNATIPIPSSRRDQRTESRSTRKRSRSRSSDRKRSRRSSADRKRRSSRSRDRSRRRSRSTDRRRSRSRDRNRRRSRSRDNRRHRSRSRGNRRRSRSREYRDRRRSRSRDRRRSRSREGRGSRRSVSRNRRVSPSRVRSPIRDFKNRSDDRIDKNRLLEIAKRRAAAAHSSLTNDALANATEHRSVEDFVTYCQKIQKLQEKEDKKDRGENVSSGEEEEVEEKESSSVKHPFGLKPVENSGIKINIMNAVQIPTRPSMDRHLDSTQLRICYPVSSGTVHKDNTDAEWEPVVASTCSADQKKYVAMTSMEREERLKDIGSASEEATAALQGPTLGGLIPPPPPPPKFSALDTLLPPPPPAPAMLLIPTRDRMIMKEPDSSAMKAAPRDVSVVLAKRARAQRELAADPNNYEARRDLMEADEKMKLWNALKQLPGEFKGSTGVSILSAEDLQPNDPRYHAWIRKDMFKRAQPTISGVGMKLMQKMGWNPGQGLGREGTGNLEPLSLDVKSDRKGLLTDGDVPARSIPKTKGAVGLGKGLEPKHPTSLLLEVCAKRKWKPPEFNCVETGHFNNREYAWTIVVNGMEYKPPTPGRTKKESKMVACQVVLQSMGLVPRDPTLPVIL